MKKITYFILVLFFSSCTKIATDNVSKNAVVEAPSTQSSSIAGRVTEPSVENSGIIAKALIQTQWLNLTDLAAIMGSHDNLRNTLISILGTKCKDAIPAIQAYTDGDLAYAALMHKFLSESNERTSEQLNNMYLGDYRNTLIVYNANHSNFTVYALQQLSNKDNLYIAYDWWLKNNQATQSKIAALNTVNNISTGFNPVFGLTTHYSPTPNSMGVLRIVKTDEVISYLGVYHKLDAGHYNLYLAGAYTADNWFDLQTPLAIDAHQGYIVKSGNAYIVAYEHTEDAGHNNMKVIWYSSYNSLLSNSPSGSTEINRTLKKDNGDLVSAEGTPDIRVVSGTMPSDSKILIGFHYYDNSNPNNAVDRLAFGTLSNFNTWKAYKDEISNYNILKMGFLGKTGARSSFIHNEKKYVLQEAQTEVPQNIDAIDFKNWRLLLGDGAFYTKLAPSVAGGAFSLGNPGIAQDYANNNFLVTSFIFTEGRGTTPDQEMIYKVHF